MVNSVLAWLYIQSCMTAGEKETAWQSLHQGSSASFSRWAFCGWKCWNCSQSPTRVLWEIAIWQHTIWTSFHFVTTYSKYWMLPSYQHYKNTTDFIHPHCLLFSGIIILSCWKGSFPYQFSLWYFPQYYERR